MKTLCKGTPTSRTFVWKHVMSQFECALWGKERSSVELADKSGTMNSEKCTPHFGKSFTCFSSSVDGFLNVLISKCL